MINVCACMTPHKWCTFKILMSWQDVQQLKYIITWGALAAAAGLDRQTYENIGGASTPGNRIEDVYEPQLFRTIPYLMVTSVVGVRHTIQCKSGCDRIMLEYLCDDWTQNSLVIYYQQFITENLKI